MLESCGFHVQGSVAGMQFGARSGRKGKRRAWAGHGTVPESKGGWKNCRGPQRVGFHNGIDAQSAIFSYVLRTSFAFAAAARVAVSGFRVLRFRRSWILIPRVSVAS